jgi:hypothetical protein
MEPTLRLPGSLSVFVGPAGDRPAAARSAAPRTRDQQASSVVTENPCFSVFFRGGPHVSVKRR